ncbi:hypothetical protein [Acinetobacter seifertii]|uniref:Uncharacterized protein n=1 Tax=Acinetobacter seifertii TaxID=1530123 RepID=A0A7H2V916_9GAMM|nr:hypothetical protein [Acinetobacter seifertii]QNX72849.1 hypothetical protein IC776_02810 [Acinetobacter seifertii]
MIKPKHFFITINYDVISRFFLFFYWLLISGIGFVVVCLLIIASGFKEGMDQPISSFFIGFLAGIPLLYLLNKKKFNIEKVIKNKPPKTKKVVSADKINQRLVIKNNHIVEPVAEKIENENVQISETNNENIEIEVKSYKEPTVYVSPPIGEYQPWNQIPDFAKNDDSIDVDLTGYRYVLEYQDRHGNITTRGIDITGVHKEYGNNRWYFLADTLDGERTFKSQRVISLKDQWFNRTYSTAKEVRKHIISEYDVIEEDSKD